MARTTRRTIYVLADAEGNFKDAKGMSYGYFLPSEKKLAEAYAAEHGFKVVERESVWCN